MLELAQVRGVVLDGESMLAGQRRAFSRFPRASQTLARTAGTAGRSVRTVDQARASWPCWTEPPRR
jgi:hypothetical protein